MSIKKSAKKSIMAATQTAKKSAKKLATSATQTAKKSTPKITKKSVKKTTNKVMMPATKKTAKKTVKKQSRSKNSVAIANKIDLSIYRNSQVLIIAGEHSGDLLGSDVVTEMKKAGYTSFFGTGGDTMQMAGVELIEHVDSMTVIGFVEVIRAYRRLKALATHLTNLALERNTKLVILIDYPGFNLRLAAMIKAQNREIQIIYVVSPQIWAWKYNRIKSIRENVDLMLTLFEFEKQIYDKENVKSEWIGHPMVNRIPQYLKHQEPIAKHRGFTLAILPGSRRSECKMLLPEFLEAARILKQSYSNLRILIPFVDQRLFEFGSEYLTGYEDLNLEISVANSLSVLQAADIVFIASGTATLEAAYFRKPMVICYRSRWLNVLIASMVMRTRFIGLPNLLAGEQVALELLQTEVQPEAIAAEGLRLLKQKRERDRIINRLNQIIFAPKKRKPSVLAVQYIEKHLQR